MAETQKIQKIRKTKIPYLPIILLSVNFVIFLILGLINHYSASQRISFLILSLIGAIGVTITYFKKSAKVGWIFVIVLIVLKLIF